MPRQATSAHVKEQNPLFDATSASGVPSSVKGPAQCAYQVNNVVSGYEEELAAMRRNDEVTRQLMTSLSHDARTPLTTLIGYLDAVCKGVVSGDERERYIRTAGRKAYELKEYIDVLFDCFKLNSDEFLFTKAYPA